MTISNFIKIYNLIGLFRWFALVYISGYCLNTFAYHLNHKTLIMEIGTYILIIIFSWVFAVGCVNLIKEIKEGGIEYHLKKTAKSIKTLFNGIF
jgi:membrane protein DedA with SNARE-associated domain